MYGEQHLLTFKSQEKTKVIYNLSFAQVGWWIAGGYLSLQAIQYLPKIPGIGTVGYLPHMIPFVIFLAFAHVTHPSTGQQLHHYLLGYLLCRRRKRSFL
ncbi:hypothetical protein [Paenibacillus tundrae]|uniref:hypothetical protein n=1 Tax=Paenibacillus tundrae TaxID=528187 RepID=UPI0008943CCB|nr:hypothetical protein [Paenibacillus tundrae]SEB27591.1 hypothetical protein SAMN03159332_6256 [Paenibacillus sp. 276b]SLK16331.1 hypothetical protein SAMN06272722_110137 [Paenibacillus sp. RU5A]SOC74330.1 hypothetical protein SAMN05880581_110137 [Paenibacillus sp. RU26A]SOC76460.1 hypothetical protein SAMN05880586_110137 [Paenibacillus sp. RU5M]MCZ1268930.1 hypothetical protein [Paenibacillus tundrae]